MTLAPVSDEIRFVEPADLVAERRLRRGKVMTGFGVGATIWGVILLSAGSVYAFVAILLGVALIVGGLIVRP